MSQERLNDLAMCSIEKAILDTIDLNTVLMILHQETPKKYLFESIDIMECKYMVVKLILEAQKTIVLVYSVLRCKTGSGALG